MKMEEERKDAHLSTSLDFLRFSISTISFLSSCVENCLDRSWLSSLLQQKPCQ